LRLRILQPKCVRFRRTFIHRVSSCDLNTCSTALSSRPNTDLFCANFFSFKSYTTHTPLSGTNTTPVGDHGPLTCRLATRADLLRWHLPLHRRSLATATSLQSPTQRHRHSQQPPLGPPTSHARRYQVAARDCQQTVELRRACHLSAGTPRLCHGTRHCHIRPCGP
jgi:hypothetical protein